jgi:predicted MFS family arabinose efflux permease
LLINWDSSSTANDHFYPFGKRADIEDYDFSEFLLYTIVPLIVLIIINLFKQPTEIRQKALQSKFDLNYEKDLTPTIIGIFLFTISLIVYFTNINNDVKGNTQLTDAVISIISFVMRIAITIWVYAISNKLNRNTTAWSIFAFILPSVALITIGLQRKLKRKPTIIKTHFK